MSCREDTSSSSSRRSADTLFPACSAAVQLLESKTNENHVKKKSFTKMMISVILHAYLFENHNPLQFIIPRVSEDVGLRAGAL